MATVQTALVDRSLRLIKAGATPTAAESADILVALNAMLDAWNLDQGLVYAMREESLTLANGTASYTVGSDGSPTLNTTRPVEIEKAWIVVSNVSYTVDPMVEAEYAAIADKTTSGDWPNRFLYRTSYPNATVIVWPVPNATRTMKLLTRVPLAAMALSDTLAAPRGYERGIVHNLACEIASEFELPIPADVRQTAANTLKAIKRQARPPARSVTDLPGIRRRGNILSDAQ